ncbi:hypothetical protein [Salinarchaeum laminariae]|uniref:hypothetical protein n=1 Tax=Salinarchaeum laminariae TaxID=869888 RepID=UPI0020C17892|nr:hypothetical protein [Salinarchaeum laminariae]
MTPAHASNRDGRGAVYETEAATVSVRPRASDGGRQALEYAVETDHPAPVRVRVHQPIPEETAIDDLGFPGDCGEDWERDGDGISFEREIPPETAVRTAWGVDGDLDPDLEPPTVEAEPVGSAVDSIADLAGESGSKPTLEETVDANGGESADHDSEEDAVADAAADGSASEASLELDLDEPGEEGSAESTDASTVELESVPDLEDLSTQTEDDATADDVGVDSQPVPEGDLLGDANAEESDVAGGEAPLSSSVKSATGERIDSDASEGDSSGSDTAAANADTEPANATAENDQRSETPTDSVVHELVAELNSEELEDRHRNALADALEVRLSDSTNAFVEHVRDRQQRRTERLRDDLETLEESVEGIYGLKADANEVSTLKRAITRIDDGKASDGDLRELSEQLETLEERSAERDTVETLRADHESLSASLEALADDLQTTDDDLDALESAAETDREAIRSDVEVVRESLEDLEDAAATEDRLEAVEDDVATLRDIAATEEALDDLENRLDAIEAEAATEADLASAREELESVESSLAERIDLLGDRHEELAADSATDDALESLREEQLDRHNETASEIQSLREELEAEYTSDDEISAEIDRRVHRGVAHLLAFAIGAVGLVATVGLAVAGSPAAAVTFFGGAGALGLWWHAVDPAEDAEE